MLVKIKYKIANIKRGSKNVHRNPKTEFRYRSLISLMANNKTRERLSQISFIRFDDDILKVRNSHNIMLFDHLECYNEYMKLGLQLL